MTQITVQTIYPIAEGAKSGSLKGADGNIYKFLPWQAKFVREGETIEVPISESEFNGKVYKWFAKTWPPKDQQNAARQAAPQPQPAAPSPGHNNPPAPSYSPNGTKDAAMFVMGVVGRAMGSGKFDTQDVKLLALAAAEAWNEVKGKL